MKQPMLKRCPILLLALGCLTFFLAAAEGKSKIVLIAGPITGHPKNTHEYEKSVILLKHLLDTSPNVRNLTVEAHFRGWPQNPATLDDADSIVLISDGGDRNATDHPLYVGDRLQQLEKQMKRGCGLVMFHWSTFNPAQHHDRITEWVGGYFDYENGSAPNKWYSAIKTWDGPTLLGTAEHPITRGVKPFRVKEEFYYNIRFRTDDPRVKPIVRTRPPGEAEDKTVGWAVERADGGRGVGYTGGHFYDNWWLPDYRRLILNAIVWSAKVELPAGGVDSQLDDPIKALIVTGHNHPAHDWRRVTQALIPVLEQDPRMIVHVTEQPEDLATARIVDYDLLVMNYSSWDRPGLSDAAKQNFVNYVNRGGGLAIIHFANGSFTDTLPNKESDWPEYRNKIVRRIWVHGQGNSGHDAFGPFKVQMTEAGKSHPITAGLSEFDTVDELYFKQMGELPITPLAVAKSKVTNTLEPMAWAYDYGKGNVFQTVLGHSDESVRKAGALIRRGSVWAAKKSQLSFDPPLELTEKVLFRDGSPWKLEDSLRRGGMAVQAPDGPPLTAGKFGQAIDARVARATVAASTAFRDPPLTVECWAKVFSKGGFQILVASDSKELLNHWEIFSFAGTGFFTAYFPGMVPDHVRSKVDITDGQWHYLAMIYEPERVQLFVDGRSVADQAISFREGLGIEGFGEFAIGSLVERSLGCDGLIDEVRISRGKRDVSRVPESALKADTETAGYWRFDSFDQQKSPDESRQRSAATIEAVKKKVAKAPSAANGRITGHWGEDAVGFRWTEQDSVDNRFQQTDTGQFFTGTIITAESSSGPQEHTTKGLCIRIGDKNEAAVCFDTDLLRISAGWIGPFLNINPARYGIIAPPKIAGDVQFTSSELPGWAKDGSFNNARDDSKRFGPLPPNHARYRGLYLHQNRVVLSYSVGNTDVLESPWFESVEGVPIFTRTLEIGPSREPMELWICDSDGIAEIVTPSPHSKIWNQTIDIAPRDSVLILTIAIASRGKVDQTRLVELTKRLRPLATLQPFTQPGPARWAAELTTRGEVGKPDPKSAPFVIDTLTLPFENPYRALFFVSGHDFVSKDVAAICTLHGDVWLVSGIDEKLERLSWKRFATGLFQPLGLKIVNGQIYVVGRDQITRLHDRDGNGEADWYENFNNEGQVTTNGHEYVTCLETDSRGNFYFLKGDSGSKTEHDGCLLRVSPDGRRLSVAATGFRNANGMAIGPNDEITVAPQEGEWTPASGIFSVVPGGFHGAMSVHHKSPPPTDYVKPICWLSRRMDNSSGGQVWIPPGHWGPLGGTMLHMSYGQCSLMLVLREEVAGQKQGGVVSLPLTFRSGVMRGRFHQGDGNLYLSGLHGWVSNSVQDGCFQRVRYTGEEAALPVKISTYSNGLVVSFTEPLNKDAAEDPDNYQAEQWNYRWSAQYGSPELKPSQPNVEGRDRVQIESATLLNDGKSVFLEIPHLQPVSVFELDCQMATASGKSFARHLSYTIHHVRANAMPESQITGRRASKYLTEQQRKSLVPGLLFHFSQPNGVQVSQDVVRRRMAIVQVPPNEAPSTFLKPGAFRVVITGFVQIIQPGKLRLQTVGSGSARAFLKGELVAEHGRGDRPNSSQALESVTHDLRGFIPLRIEYEHDTKNEPAEFQLLWQREDGIEESIPPTALFCLEDIESRASEDRRQVMDLVIQSRCTKCHQFGSHDTPSVLEAVTADGPSLKFAGDRLNPAWIESWVLSPASMRNDATMPGLLGSFTADWLKLSRPQPQQLTESLKKASHLAAFISSLRVSPDADPRVRFLIGDVRSGKRLWEQLGCIGCHRLTPVSTPDEFNRISLQFVVKKYRPDALLRYLKQPHANYAATRMPDLHLSDDEANALSAFLADKLKQEFAGPGVGDKNEGRRLAKALRCHACHDFGPALPQEGIAAARKQIRAEAVTASSCLASEPQGEITPRFNLTVDQKKKLQTALVKERTASWQLCAAEEAERQFESLRCNVCHSRDQQSSLLPTILAEEGEFGWLPEALPNLTWTGERLQRNWMAQFIGGKILNAERPRPYLTTRMPAFPGYAEILARGFAAQHGIGDTESATTSPIAADRDLTLGYRLTLKDVGLDCRQCHAVGTQAAQGDDKTRLAPGINFVQVPQRLRYDFYRRFVLDPPRYDPNTRMPKLSADGRTTTIQHIHDGDARLQFDSIWHYLQTLQGAEP